MVSTETPYCTPAALLDFVDAREVADALRDDDGPRPSKAAMLDPTAEAGARLARLCLTASGELESACLGRGLYAPADLQALAGGTKAYLEKVVAGLVVLALFARRLPATGRAKEAADAAEAALDRLRVGERIFGVAANIAAGAGTQAVTLTDTTAANTRRTVSKARRFFGTRGADEC